MADSKHLTQFQSVMTAAMCFRVKYRKTTGDGRVARQRVRIEVLGVHPKNRGGVYPSGLRLQSLTHSAFDAGFLIEEFTTNAVAVEEPPADEVRSRGEGYVSASTYNITASKKDELLVTCFQEPFNDVRNTLLGHNHMMLVLRAFLTRAKWDLPPIEKKNLVFCDDKGHLDITAVAAHENGIQAQMVLNDGIDCEVLSWRMDVEEPGAAEIISQALNKGNDIAMRTTELTAVAVLKGEIMVQMNKDVAQKVAFSTVRDKVRMQLDAAADDPDLPELFDFLISAGVGVNSFVDDFLEWAGCFVDSKKRQLRFSAFTTINKICEEAPWTKIAVLKRTYRKKPSNGFCPNPEPMWGNFPWGGNIQWLEELLRFFHVACKDRLAKLPPQSRQKHLANIDIGCTEAFMNAKSSKPIKTSKDIQKALLENAVKKNYLEELGISMKNDKVEGMPEQCPAWINWETFAKTEPAEPTDAPSASSSASDGAKIHVIKFDEATGTKLTTQVEFAAKEQARKTKEEEKPISVPWRQWFVTGSSVGHQEADMATAVAVMHGIHEHYPLTQTPIDVQMRNGKLFVKATKATEEATLWLPPCMPKSCKVVKESLSANRVRISVAITKTTKDNVKDDADRVLRKFQFYINPEWKSPKHEEQGQEWFWTGEESMHPFWSVRRLSAQELQKEQKERTEKKIEGPPLRFNCKLVEKEVSNITVLSMPTGVKNRTRVVSTQWLTNSVALEENEELILQLEKPKKPDNKRTWRDVEKEEAVAKAAKAKKPKAEPKKKSA